MPDFPDDVLSVILFGSQARGDADLASDVDVCVFATDAEFEDLQLLKSSCADVIGVPLESVTVYTDQVLSVMSAQGALLLWHIKQEGKVIFDPGSYASILLEHLQPFHTYDEEYAVYEDLILGVEQAVSAGRTTSALDCHVLQVVIRNVCILLMYFLGQPTYGRYTAVQSAMTRVPGLPIVWADYFALCEWHLSYLRGITSVQPAPTRRQLAQYLLMARATLECARKITN